MRRHGTADFGLLANDHALQTPRIPESQTPGHAGGADFLTLRPLRITSGILLARIILKQSPERLTQPMKVVANLVDSLLLGFDQPAVRPESVLLEEEADLVAAREEVVIADVLGCGAGGEAGHGMIIKTEGGEEAVRLVEQSGNGGA